MFTKIQNDFSATYEDKLDRAAAQTQQILEDTKKNIGFYFSLYFFHFLFHSIICFDFISLFALFSMLEFYSFVYNTYLFCSVHQINLLQETKTLPFWWTKRTNWINIRSTFRRSHERYREKFGGRAKNGLFVFTSLLLYSFPFFSFLLFFFSHFLILFHLLLF